MRFHVPNDKTAFPHLESASHASLTFRLHIVADLALSHDRASSMRESMLRGEWEEFGSF
jgi:hypothetical protein